MLALAAALMIAASTCAGGAAPPAADPPSIEEFLGFDPIAEARAVGAAQVALYLRALAAASPRVRVESIGLTTDGRPLEMALISSPQNLAAVGRPAGTGAPGKPPIPVLITCSIHSDEVGPSLMSLRLVHRLAAGRTAGADAILRELLLLVFPSANPDGLEMVRQSAGDARAWPGPLPALYQRYIGHDNNRDWLLLTQAETRAFARLYGLRKPRLTIDVHQMGRYGARLFLPPYASPAHPGIPRPFLERVDTLGTEVRARLARAGKTGIVTASNFDAWSPARAYSFFHGAPRLLIEVAGGELFRPVMADRLSSGWGIPQIVDYTLSAVEAALQAVSEAPEPWRSGNGGPGAGQPGDLPAPCYLVPAGEGDPWAAREVLESLRLAGARVTRSAEGWRVAAPADGPGGLGGWIGALLECTPYPPASGDSVPYDGTCHDLAHLAGLPVRRAESGPDSKYQEAPVRMLPGSLLPGSAPGGFIIDTRSLSVLREVADLIHEGHPVLRTRDESEAAGHQFPAGSLLVTGAPRPWIERIARETGAIAAAAPTPEPRSSRLRRPRVGVLAAATPSIDEGWTRWVLEEFRIPFRSVRDLASGVDGIDVLVVPEETLPSDGGEASRVRARAGLEAFCSEGGRVVALGTSARKIASWMKLPLQDLAESGTGAAPIRASGVLLRARPTPAGADHSVLHGVVGEAPLYFTDGPFWSLHPRGPIAARPEPVPCRGLLEFPPGGAVLCGAMAAGEAPAGAFPLVEVKKGSGEILLFGFRPQFRGWTLGSQRILLNAILRDER